MTFDEFQAVLTNLQVKQGTKCPLVRIDLGGTVVQGRVARMDSDHECRKDVRSPFGVLVLESPGLCPAPERVVQIADIPADAIQSSDRG